MKSTGKSDRDEDLEARIARIRSRNAAIEKRHREVEADKKASEKTNSSISNGAGHKVIIYYIFCIKYFKYLFLILFIHPYILRCVAYKYAKYFLKFQEYPH